LEYSYAGVEGVLAKYELKNIKHPIGVSDYQLNKAIVEESKSQLPDVLVLKQELLNDNELINFSLYT